MQHMDDLIETHVDNLSKLNYQFANVIAEALNARYKLFFHDGVDLHLI